MPGGSESGPESAMTGELERARKREAATREILDLISMSRDDEKPVFDTILHRVADLCDADAACLILGKAGDTHQRMAASYGVDPATVAIYDRGEVSMNPDTSFAARAILTGKVVHVEDMIDTELYRQGAGLLVSIVRDTGIRTEMFVPLLAPGGVIGCFTIFRNEVRPYIPDEMALAETFAAQAVIAIENVRQFRELQTANAELETRLAREAATREILEVISHSREDDAPVFEVVLRKAADLCHASLADLSIVSEDRSHAVLVADWGEMPRYYAVGSVWPMDTENAFAITMRQGHVMHVHDLADTDLYRSGDPIRVNVVDVEGIRTFLTVPLLSGGRAVGCIAVYRREVNPFKADEIALVETFAAQAVIAIENVRQFRELQERLAREAATKNILRVISESPDDEQPTFEAILDSATRLCGTQNASLVLGRRGDASQRMVAHRSATAETLALFREGKVPMDPEDSIAARAILAGITIHVPDMADTDQYRAGHERFRMVVDRQGLRTNLFVPLLGPEGGIGCLVLWKKEVAPFTADQIALMEIFASHAVIAIENVRQFKALEALNAELGDRVQAQVGEIERMGRLKRFLPAAVADAVVSSGSEKMLSSHRALLGVLFCDIRGFTPFCETAEPEETIEVLQAYHEEMGKLINAHGAGVDHRMGDGIMVLFNDPLPCEDPAGTAVRLGIAMRDRMVELCAKWKKMGHRLGFGVGISLGYATVGMVGSGERQDYTASGTAVNLAERLCGEALDGEILLSPRARTAVEDRFPVELRGEFTLKGIREPVEVFRLTGIAAA